MPESIRPETQARIRALCQKISVSFDLDSEIQEELHGHLEDKLLAYLSAEEHITEEDAFILVREHFGNPAVLKSLFQDVHVYGYRIGFARRLLGAFTATSGVLILQSAMLFLVALGFIAWVDSFGMSYSARVLLAALMASIQLIFTCLMCWILYRWQQRIARGDRPWFVRWPIPAVVGLAIVLALVQRAIPFADYGALLSFSTYQTAMWIAYLYLVACAGVSMVVSCMAWIWWCDRPPRAARAVLYAFAVWLAVQTLGSLVMPAVLSVYVAEDGPPLRGLLPYINIAQGPLADNSLTWFLRWEVPNSVRLHAGAYFLIMYATAGYLSRVLYRLIPRLHPVLPKVRGQ
jgi:hypothetical protein